jgi:protein-disulfide isomerase
MASREDEKRARREEREAREAQAALADRRKRRLQMLGIAAAAVVVVVVGAIIISSSGSSDKGGKQKGPATGATTVQSQFAGIPQSGLTLGDPKAPVTVVEFADLQCPFCKEAAAGIYPDIVSKYVKTGKVQMQYRTFAILGDDSVTAAKAAVEAGNQNKAWDFIDLWYKNQGEENSGYVTDAFINRIASGVPGLNAAKVVAASHSGDTTALQQANTEASKFGVNSTPTFLVGKTGGTLQKVDISDPTSAADLEAAINAASGQ